ncbi:MAG: hypothetical protein IKE29_03215 [Paenibacillus sp.]|uniref:hypothetical protein n=1 Tax=Paenibacillus sp. TaxID=58172 RepID=UPI0025E85A69|nr:hypothetical protein [Paenibacillus sp.]MBR2563612.1 hypothetical protein [Paenibacillus sp.]
MRGYIALKRLRKGDDVLCCRLPVNNEKLPIVPVQSQRIEISVTHPIHGRLQSILQFRRAITGDTIGLPPRYTFSSTDAVLRYHGTIVTIYTVSYVSPVWCVTIAH